MDNWLDTKAIITAGILAVAGGQWALLQFWFRTQRDRKAIDRWLKINTRDEPGESHIAVSDLSKRIGLSEDRVNKAVAKSHIVLRSERDVNQISIWRKEPQSIYEKRGIRRV